MSSHSTDEGEHWNMPAGDVPAFLLRYQQQHGPSQHVIAERTGTSQATISHFLTGRWKTWRILTTVRVATALGLETSVTFRRPARRPEKA